VAIVTLVLRWNRRRREAEQEASAADQTAADADQTAADADQTASDRDQAHAEADQRASDRDQAASDRDLTSLADRDERQRTHARSRSERAAGTDDRQMSTLARAQVSADRDAQAKQRDRSAQTRDRVADQRDALADEQDRVSALLYEEGGDAEALSKPALEALGAARAKAAAQRAEAAGDRERGAHDRGASAADRDHFLAELEREQLDELTGAHRRGMGKVVLQHEVERARRSETPLTLAFIDCDGLKELNDRDGHAAGDRLLNGLVGRLRSKLRPMDPLVRWGGDEFICTMANTDSETAHRRFAEIRATLAEYTAGASITVGLASLREDDSLDGLMERADADLLEERSTR
jgi:diguanylate cyclase (GGDEF)-like protein